MEDIKDVLFKAEALQSLVDEKFNEEQKKHLEDVKNHIKSTIDFEDIYVIIAISTLLPKALESFDKQLNEKR